MTLQQQLREQSSLAKRFDARVSARLEYWATLLDQAESRREGKVLLDRQKLIHLMVDFARDEAQFIVDGETTSDVEQAVEAALALNGL